MRGRVADDASARGGLSGGRAPAGRDQHGRPLPRAGRVVAAGHPPARPRDAQAVPVRAARNPRPRVRGRARRPSWWLVRTPALVPLGSSEVAV